ncbi:MAG: protein-glutamate O-methyltransferase CheR [Deltaproteobacteria bacterium]|nr:protein-glutamate O-methyltransferase CheR [Deltaproteobacteria bacterium]
MTIKITSSDFPRLKGYIEKQCGIALRDSQQYLLESRLNKLLAQHQCSSFAEFYQLAMDGRVPGLNEKIVNAMTTNETLWFRDTHPWQSFQDVLLPEWDAQLKGPAVRKRIWSAAASMGQEAYSMSMLIDTYCRMHPASALSRNVEIVGTDISTSALYVAISGNYDAIAMSRGFGEPWTSYKNRYFTAKQKVWELSEDIRKMVSFRHFNLQQSFESLGKFDLICLRNVIIYFSDEFKKDLFDRMANSLNPSGYLLLGASETPIRYTSRFKSMRIGQSTFYQLKDAP